MNRIDETVFAGKTSVSREEIERAHKAMLETAATIDRCSGIHLKVTGDFGWEIDASVPGRIKLISRIITVDAALELGPRG